MKLAINMITQHQSTQSASNGNKPFQPSKQRYS